MARGTSPTRPIIGLWQLCGRPVASALESSPCTRKSQNAREISDMFDCGHVAVLSDPAVLCASYSGRFIDKTECSASDLVVFEQAHAPEQAQAEHWEHAL